MLIAPCCYTQTIDLHNSEIAARMRSEVRSMTLAGKSDAEIYSFYKSIYGERILAVPDGTLGQVAFAIPITVTTVATGTLFLLLRRFHQRRMAVLGTPSVRTTGISESVRAEIRRHTEW